MKRCKLQISGLILLVALTGCSRQDSQNSNLSNPANPVFDQLLQTSIEELKLKTAVHQVWGLGKFDSWNVDQDIGNLVFSNTDGFTATCPVQIIGTFDSVGRTWMWAWNNPSVTDKLKIDSLKVKLYGETNHITQLTTSEYVCDESNAWAMTAFAVKLCGAQGAYRGPAGSTYVFMSFGSVKLAKSK